jgi:ABC-type transport system involved in Fe-S cluster assembly, ATPase component
LSDNILKIRDLDVFAGETQVLRDVDLTIHPGEVHILLGPNGSGKSSLLQAIMGVPPFRVTKGDIRLNGRSICDLTPDQRAALGFGMAYQKPPEIDGVTLTALAHVMRADATFATEAAALDMADFAQREVNVGFSGGEIKRWEVLKLFLQNPQFLLFDEPESGVDLEHIAAVGAAIERLARSRTANGAKRAALVITHTGFILDYVKADTAHMMVDGRIIATGDPKEMFEQVKSNGYHAA